MKKFLAGLLCLCMIFCLCACGSKTTEEAVEDTVEDSAEAVAEETAEEAVDETTDVAEDVDVSEVAESSSAEDFYPLDTVVLTVNGSAVTWEEYYDSMKTAVNSILTYVGEITDWDASVTTDGRSASQYVKDYAYETCVTYHAVQVYAEELGVSPTDEEIQTYIEEYVDANMGDADGEYTEEDQAALDEYCTTNDTTVELLTLYTKENMTEQYLYNSLTAEYTDEYLLNWANEQGYLAAKHILFSTASTTEEELTEEELSAIKQEAQTTYEDLKKVYDTNKDNMNVFESYFDSVMEEKSYDTGYQSFPDGYIFLAAEMVSEFSDTVVTLDENYGLSEPVESSLGYHIILRLPLNLDTAVSSASSSYNQLISLRAWALSQLFSEKESAYVDAATITWEADFENCNPADFF